MNEELQTILKIRQELAQLMAIYGDRPTDLMYKLELLILEWYFKGKKAKDG